MQTYACIHDIHACILSKQNGYGRTNEYKLFYMFGSDNFKKPSIVEIQAQKRKEKWWLPMFDSLPRDSNVPAIKKAIGELKLGYIYEKLLDGECEFLKTGSNSEWLQAAAKDILHEVCQK